MEHVSLLRAIFDTLITQLVIVGLKVKISKYHAWSLLGLPTDFQIFDGCIFSSIGLRIFGLPMGTDEFIFQYLEDVFMEDILHPYDLSLLRYHHVVFDILTSCFAHHSDYLSCSLSPFPILLSHMRNFDMKMIQILGDIIR